MTIIQNRVTETKIITDVLFYSLIFFEQKQNLFFSFYKDIHCIFRQVLPISKKSEVYLGSSAFYPLTVKE